MKIFFRLLSELFGLFDTELSSWSIRGRSVDALYAQQPPAILPFFCYLHPLGAEGMKIRTGTLSPGADVEVRMFLSSTGGSNNNIARRKVREYCPPSSARRRRRVLVLFAPTRLRHALSFDLESRQGVAGKSAALWPFLFHLEYERGG